MAALAVLQRQFGRDPSLSVRYAQRETNHARSHGLGEFKVSRIFVVLFHLSLLDLTMCVHK